MSARKELTKEAIGDVLKKHKPCSLTELAHYLGYKGEDQRQIIQENQGDCWR